VWETKFSYGELKMTRRWCGEEARELMKQIDWDREEESLLRDRNLGCKW
jgi:hypothetical protein